MKRIAFILIVLLVAAAGYWLAAPNKTLGPQVNRPSAGLSTTRPTTTNTDPGEVFQHAFWKRPTADDRILHAERREWADSHGIKQWQWFIAVEPSAELVKHLREDNAFNLVPATAVKPVEQAPDWFTPGSASSVLQSPSGNLRLVFDDKAHTLYATDSGGGFRAGAPEPGKPFPQTVAAGRLPTSPPPKP